MTGEKAQYRPAWLDSLGLVVVLVVAAAMWAYFMVATFAKSAYGLAAIDAFLFIGTVWTITRILRRRRGRRS